MNNLLYTIQRLAKSKTMLGFDDVSDFFQRFAANDAVLAQLTNRMNMVYRSHVDEIEMASLLTQGFRLRACPNYVGNIFLDYFPSNQYKVVQGDWEAYASTAMVTVEGKIIGLANAVPLPQ